MSSLPSTSRGLPETDQTDEGSKHSKPINRLHENYKDQLKKAIENLKQLQNDCEAKGFKINFAKCKTSEQEPGSDIIFPVAYGHLQRRIYESILGTPVAGKCDILFEIVTKPRIVEALKVEPFLDQLNGSQSFVQQDPAASSDEEVYETTQL